VRQSVVMLEAMSVVKDAVEGLYLDCSHRRRSDCHEDREISISSTRGGEVSYSCMELLLMYWSDTDVLEDRRDDLATVVTNAVEHLETGWSFTRSATEEDWRNRRCIIEDLFERICREYNVQFYRQPIGRVKPVWASSSAAEWRGALEYLSHRVCHAFVVSVVAGDASGSMRILTCGDGVGSLPLLPRHLECLVLKSQEAGGVEALRSFILAGYLARMVYVNGAHRRSCDKSQRLVDKFIRLYRDEEVYMSRLWTQGDEAAP
jgi:hypothetical protein